MYLVWPKVAEKLLNGDLVKEAATSTKHVGGRGGGDASPLPSFPPPPPEKKQIGTRSDGYMIITF